MIGVLSRKAFYNVRFSLRISDILLLRWRKYYCYIKSNIVSLQVESLWI